MYRTVVFLQDSEAVEALDILDKNGEDDLFEYLLQWECGDEGADVREEPPYGRYDMIFERGEYVISYDWNGQYVSLTEVI